MRSKHSSRLAASASIVPSMTLPHAIASLVMSGRGSPLSALIEYSSSSFGVWYFDIPMSPGSRDADIIVSGVTLLTIFLSFH